MEDRHVEALYEGHDKLIFEPYLWEMKLWNMDDIALLTTPCGEIYFIRQSKLYDIHEGDESNWVRLVRCEDCKGHGGSGFVRILKGREKREVFEKLIAEANHQPGSWHEACIVKFTLNFSDLIQ